MEALPLPEMEEPLKERENVNASPRVQLAGRVVWNRTRPGNGLAWSITVDGVKVTSSQAGLTSEIVTLSAKAGETARNREATRSESFMVFSLSSWTSGPEPRGEQTLAVAVYSFFEPQVSRPSYLP